MSQTHARSAGENTCREVKVRSQGCSNVRYSKVVDSDVHVEAIKKEGVYKTSVYQISLIRFVGTIGLQTPVLNIQDLETLLLVIQLFRMVAALST